MLYQIASFLLDVLGGLFAGACLLRLYMQWQRVGFANPVGGLVFALTDWLVIPLRRVLVPVGRWDGASLVAALLLQLAQYFLLALMWADSAWTWLPWLALLGLMRVVVSGLTGLLIVHAVLSWVQGRSVLADMLARLSAPLLRPLRRVVPLVNGIDFTPLLALVLLQVLMIVLGHLQASVLR
ncbi:YggT family protein [Verminephrobacter eiseniae]|uniref:YggT family protein n=1 Tax=Verminephrobacter eiseniae TaxID=364317 RepID=UPI002238BD05|nr:YggT family protein [Verminephrobacter eiseniae]MCW5232706.1 YggT family protein [Verminephrobacter eiseniae]MCW5295730.1 YggT family protein [Verminephrobacter eiseniae]MCW8184609.1 YggT family protein [Verminephrobacter eiseniae]MCW8223285.1 YggT family protein [Verminephrobacter eiseniae]MCW8232462.1 YggT family protein [Verminephrobacter eiseniae]